MSRKVFFKNVFSLYRESKILSFLSGPALLMPSMERGSSPSETHEQSGEVS